MIPVRTCRSNLVYRGPTPDVGDAWVDRRRAGEVYLTWKPSEEERAAIAGGALIELGIYAEPIPPVSLNVAAAPELSTAGCVLRDRALAELKKVSRGPGSVPPGHWIASADVWASLQAEGALDTSGTSDLPKLYGRPLMEVEQLTDVLEYAVALDPQPAGAGGTKP